MRTVRDADGVESKVRSAKYGKGSRWRARYVDARGQEQERLFARKIDAAKWLDGITSTIVTGTYVAPGAGSVTVGAIHEQWLKMQAHVKDSTRAARASAWAVHVQDRWHDVTVADVQTSAVRAWVGDLHRPERTAVAARQRRPLRTHSGCCEWCSPWPSRTSEYRTIHAMA